MDQDGLGGLRSPWYFRVQYRPYCVDIFAYQFSYRIQPFATRYRILCSTFSKELAHGRKLLFVISNPPTRSRQCTVQLLFEMRLLGLEGVVQALSMFPHPQKTLGDDIQPDDRSDMRSFKAGLPGGSPLQLCEVSRPTDLFGITSVELTKQPIYMYVRPAWP